MGEEPRDLPGPSRVVTGPGQVGFDPVTGARRRRTGISSVPTSVILPDSPRAPPRPREDLSPVEEYEAESEEEEEDGTPEEDDLQRKSSFGDKRAGEKGRVSDSHTFHADPEPDPGFQIFAYPDPDPGLQIFVEPDPRLLFFS